jgi:hypothetical protein
MGGLPESRGPVAVKQFGTLSADGFRVGKIAYESLPGFWVTADLYVPATGCGPFPAVMLSPGHRAEGKLEDWTWGSNLARMGIIALAYDPFGQGERLQYFDPDLKASKIGDPTGEQGDEAVVFVGILELLNAVRFRRALPVHIAAVLRESPSGAAPASHVHSIDLASIKRDFAVDEAQLGIGS